MKFRPRIGQADYTVKVRKVAEFLADGHRVRVTIMFRGREAQHPEVGERLCQRIVDDTAHLATATPPIMGGRDMTMTLTPKGRRDGGPGVREPRSPRDNDPSRVRRRGREPRLPDPDGDLVGAGHAGGYNVC